MDVRLADLVRELRAQYERRVRQATTAPVVDKGVAREEIGDELLHRLLHELDLEAEHLRTSLDLLADGPAATLQPASASR